MSKRMIFALHKLQCHILARSHQYWALLFHSQICRGLLACPSTEATFATVAITAQHIGTRRLVQRMVRWVLGLLESYYS